MLIPFLRAVFSLEATEPVADAAHRFQILWMRRVILDLLADAVDVHHDRGRIPHGLTAPNLLKQRFPAEDDVRILSKKRQDFKLPPRERDFLPAQQDPVGILLDLKVTAADDMHLRASIRSRLDKGLKPLLQPVAL